MSSTTLVRCFHVLALLSAGAGPVLAQASAADRLSWMAGCWEQRRPGRVVTEMWMPPAAGGMMGASRTISGTRMTEFEQLRIVARGDTLVYIALPSGQQLTEFRSAAVTDTSVAFENRAHDFPQVIRYWLGRADSLFARVEGPGPNNTTRGITYPMLRVSCTQMPAPPPPPPRAP
jgi:hypothetical protein